MDRLEMLLRALPFEERLALEARWAEALTPPEEQLVEAEAASAEAGDGCGM